MTMSRKSIESRSICSRRRTLGSSCERSSSGAMVWMMSLTARVTSSSVMVLWGWQGMGMVGGGSRAQASDDDGRVDAEHAEGHVQDRLDPADRARLVGDEVRDRALGIELVEVDGRVDDAVRERGQVAGELERAGRAHGVADEALRVVDPGPPGIAEDL